MHNVDLIGRYSNDRIGVIIMRRGIKNDDKNGNHNYLNDNYCYE